MLVIFAFLLAIIPAVAILIPFVLKKKLPYLSDEEIHLVSPISDWESAIFDLKNLELEFAIGNLTKEEYDLKIKELNQKIQDPNFWKKNNNNSYSKS